MPLARRLASRIDRARHGHALSGLGGVPPEAILVADIDLDAGTVTVVPSVHPMERAPQGVYALVWLHGEPIGSVTVLDDPETALNVIVERARQDLAREIVEHHLRDALVGPGLLHVARDRGLAAVAHPSVEPDGRTVTVAVCTRDKPESLRQCLAALTALDPAPEELLVIDNASADDSTRAVVAEFPAARYVREPRPGLDWARNRALLEAQGDIIAYTDDDVLVHEQWVGNLRRAFAEEPTAAAVTGLVAPAELTSLAQVLFEANGGFDRGYRRRYFSAAVKCGEVAARVFGLSGAAGTGANMAFVRRRLLELGGFDPALDVGTVTGGGGDLEMFFRVVAAGDLLVYEPSAVVRHVHRHTVKNLVKQRKGDGTGSYSFWSGAGARYDARQAEAFRELAWHWFRSHHLRGGLRSVVLRSYRGREFAAAEGRGLYEAVRRDLYGQAEARAAELRELFLAEPALPGPVRPVSHPVAERRADPVISVDLLDGVVDDDSRRWPDLLGFRRVRVRVARAGVTEAVVTVASRGAGMSPARLRRELAAELGPALLRGGLPQTITSATSVVSGAEPRQRLGLSPSFREVMTGVGDPAASALDADVAVTVLVVTREGPMLLERCLKSIKAQQTQRSVQLVVVDNSSDAESTREVAHQHDDVVLIHEPRPGLSRARNAGLAAASGDIVATIDEEVDLPVDWLERLIAPFCDPAVAAVTGDVLPDNLESLEAQVFEDHGGLGRGPHPQVFDRDWLLWSRTAAPTWRVGTTANAAFRRSILLELGPFAESLGPGTPAAVGDDAEYFYRVLRAGGVVAYEPAAVAHHAQHTTRTALRKKLTEDSAGWVAYHLDILTRYGDARGLRRVAVSQPRSLLAQRRRTSQTVDDFPRDLTNGQVLGMLYGPRAWLRARKAARPLR